MYKKISIYSDGGSRGNPGPAAAAFVAKSQNNKRIGQENIFLGKTTNNVAEYNGVLLAWHWLDKLQAKPQRVDFYIDSQLVVKQLNGEYKIKSNHLQTLVMKIKRLEKQANFDIYYHHVRREKNTEADSLLNEALDLEKEKL